jgi:hypothetical protein
MMFAMTAHTFNVPKILLLPRSKRRYRAHIARLSFRLACHAHIVNFILLYRFRFTKFVNLMSPKTDKSENITYINAIKFHITNTFLYYQK